VAVALLPAVAASGTSTDPQGEVRQHLPTPF
jgi:hypothetical protein